MQKETHHIVFRSQGGLNFPLNLIDLTIEEHHGNLGPHRCRARDLELKRNLQATLEQLFREETYTSAEIAGILHVSKRYIDKHFKRVPQYLGKYSREEIIKRLMGGKFY